MSDKTPGAEAAEYIWFGALGASMLAPILYFIASGIKWVFETGYSLVVSNSFDPAVWAGIGFAVLLSVYAILYAWRVYARQDKKDKSGMQYQFHDGDGSLQESYSEPSTLQKKVLEKVSPVTSVEAHNSDDDKVVVYPRKQMNKPEEYSKDPVDAFEERIAELPDLKILGRETKKAPKRFFYKIAEREDGGDKN